MAAAELNLTGARSPQRGGIYTLTLTFTDSLSAPVPIAGTLDLLFYEAPAEELLLTQPFVLASNVGVATVSADNVGLLPVGTIAYQVRQTVSAVPTPIIGGTCTVLAPGAGVAQTDATATVSLVTSTVAITVTNASTTGGGSGDVVGPASVTNDRLGLFDGTSGKLIKQGSVTGTAVAAHLTDTSDPHGDRAFATSAIATHAAAVDPHADRAYTDSGLALKANLASPALTGIPTAPTASTPTSNTQIATTAFVQQVVAALIASAPGALDTLDELAAAMGDDANFAATMATNLATKLAKASNLSDLTDVAAARTALGLLIGANVQAFDATLTALATLDASAGLLEQTGADTFTKRALGVAASTSIPTRADADARYAPVGSGGMSIGGTVAGATAGRVPYFAAGPVLAESELLTFTSGILTSRNGLSPVSGSVITGPGISLNAGNSGSESTTFQGSGANFGRCGKTGSTPYFALSSAPGGASAFDSFIWCYGANDFAFGNSTEKNASAVVRVGNLLMQVFTVATLPSATSGRASFVSDANSTAFGSVVAGGGANAIKVYADGTDWRIG